MLPISLPWIIEAFNTVNALEDLSTEQTMSDVWPLLFNAKKSLESVYRESIYGPALRSSREHAGEVLAVLDGLLKQYTEDRKITDVEAWQVKYNKARFTTVFLAELSILPVFFVTQKEIFDTNLLINAGVSLFPPALTVKAPETLKDANEVGKALAFELPTSCGFHAFRVTESVVRRYWDAASKGTARPKLETLGNFAAEMEKHNFGDGKIVESIKQMTKLHRNPLIHPAVILTTEEAIGIVGMARSVIGPMLSVLPDAPSTTETPVQSA